MKRFDTSQILLGTRVSRDTPPVLYSLAHQWTSCAVHAAAVRYLNICSYMPLQHVKYWISPRDGSNSEETPSAIKVLMRRTLKSTPPLPPVLHPVHTSYNTHTPRFPCSATAPETCAVCHKTAFRVLTRVHWNSHYIYSFTQGTTFDHRTGK